jgi:cation diffusion facilitator CzcD-associated flavoprotein CzcO
MPFPDFPFHETEASFVHHSDVLKYLKDYAQHYDLYRQIRVRVFINFVNFIFPF